jgi:hypothetical protein
MQLGWGRQEMHIEFLYANLFQHFHLKDRERERERCGDNIKIDVRETNFEGGRCKELAQYRMILQDYTTSGVEPLYLI